MLTTFECERSEHEKEDQKLNIANTEIGLVEWLAMCSLCNQASVIGKVRLSDQSDNRNEGCKANLSVQLNPIESSAIDMVFTWLQVDV